MHLFIYFDDGFPWTFHVAHLSWPFTRIVPYEQRPNVENSSQVGWVSYRLAPKSFNYLWYNESDCVPTIQVWIPNVTKQLDGNNWYNWNQNLQQHQFFSIKLCFLHINSSPVCPSLESQMASHKLLTSNRSGSNGVDVEAWSTTLWKGKRWSKFM